MSEAHSPVTMIGQSEGEGLFGRDGHFTMSAVIDGGAQANALPDPRPHMSMAYPLRIGFPSRQAYRAACREYRKAGGIMLEDVIGERA